MESGRPSCHAYRAQDKYASAGPALENQTKIGFGEKVGVSRVEGDRIITEFKDRKSVVRTRLRLKRNFDYTE